MISRIIQRRLPNSIAVLSVRPGLNFMICGRYSTDAASPATKTFKASSFNQPKDVPPVAKGRVSEASQQDFDDFRVTKLVHGITDMKIAITKRASDKLTSIAEEDRNPKTALKVEVESGGCHGFQYNLVLTDLNKELNDKNDELLVFKRMEDDNEIAQIILDDSSLQILQDSKLDYTKELIGSQFKMVDSPYTSTACGCGASFDFDFEKLEKAKAEANK